MSGERKEKSKEKKNKDAWQSVNTLETLHCNMIRALVLNFIGDDSVRRYQPATCDGITNREQFSLVNK